MCKGPANPGQWEITTCGKSVHTLESLSDASAALMVMSDLDPQ